MSDEKGTHQEKESLMQQAGQAAPPGAYNQPAPAYGPPPPGRGSEHMSSLL